MDVKCFDSLEKPALLFYVDSGALYYANNAAMILFACKQEVSQVEQLFSAKSRNAASILLDFAKMKSVNHFCFTFETHDGFIRERMLCMGTHEIDGKQMALCLFDDMMVQSQDELRQKEQYYDIFQKIFFMSHYRQEVSDILQSVLAIVGAYLRCSHTRIFKLSYDARLVSIANEWCADCTPPSKSLLHPISTDRLGNLLSYLENHSFISVADAATTETLDGFFYKEYRMKAAVLFALYGNNKLIGFFAVDEVDCARHWTNSELELLRGISILLSTLLARQEMEAESLRSRTLFLSILDSMDEIIYVTDVETREILYANHKLHEIAGPDLVGKPCSLALFGETEDCAICNRRNLISQAVPVGQIMLSEMRSARSKRWYIAKDRLIPWLDGRTVHFRACIDITERKEYEQSLMRLMQTDKMTGIFARDYGISLLKEAIEHAQATHKAITVGFLDVDGLKLVNDQYGHAEGDVMLTTIAHTVRAAIRFDDVLARLGGDEFLLVLPACRFEGAQIIAKAIHDDLDKLNQSGQYPYTLAASIGFYEVQQGQMDIDDILRLADAEMYANKMSRRAQRRQKETI